MDTKSLLVFNNCAGPELKPTSVCTTCRNRTGSIFCGLSKEQLLSLEKEKIMIKYEPDQIIFCEGNPAFMAYHIFSGQVKITKTGLKGDVLVFRLLGPGDFFGYRALLAKEPYLETAKAVMPSMICGFQKEIFFDVLKRSPEFTMRIMTKLSRDVRTAEEQTLSLAQENVKQRVVRLLLFFYHNREDEKIKSIIETKYISRIEMSQMIGTTPETFSRTLHFFAEQGHIRVSRTAIQIVNPTALKLSIPKLEG